MPTTARESSHGVPTIPTDAVVMMIPEIPLPKADDDGEIPATPSDASNTDDEIGKSGFVGMVHFNPESESIYLILSDSDNEAESSVGPRNVFMAELEDAGGADNDDLVGEAQKDNNVESHHDNCGDRGR